jgi:hypothetical protein
MYQLQKFWVNVRDESENQPVGKPFGEFKRIQDAVDWANRNEPMLDYTYEIVGIETGRLMSQLAFDWE